ncbi:MAG: MaoC family dehydratase N-terminal domain-containing protein [Deltaproteobacteria bacterium]|nr:MaoC family dehydratase N-terminal domain-containing protein [Deltaproteobacteria bacterium]
MAKVAHKSIKVGDLIPALVRSPVSRVQISQFAAAVNDFGPMHVDEQLAKSKGLSGIFAHGQLAFAYCEQALRQYAENAEIVQITTTFQKLIWPGDILTCKGLISKCYQSKKRKLIDLELWVENQNQDVVLKGKATCEVK